MARHALFNSADDTIVDILSLIDLSLMGNLLLMIMFGGYQNFGYKLEPGGHEDTPEWIGHVGFSDLKLKLMASIVAISAIEVLKAFMKLGSVSNRELVWGIGAHMTFVVSAVLLAFMDLLMARARKHSATA
ncbi:YqhA family protein [Paraburkholderia fungorum]|uniref:YqhA family protein n=1 Tax=Paraburkholderia fungorum TaxID=134537 RepID=UPI0038B812F9